MEIIAAFWKELAALVGLVAWLVRLESRAMENTRRITELEKETKNNQIELKRDLESIRIRIDERTAVLEKILLENFPRK